MVAFFLEDWELARVALSCHSQEMKDACTFRCVRGVLKIWKIPSPWKGRASKERSVVREVKG